MGTDADTGWAEIAQVEKGADIYARIRAINATSKILIQRVQADGRRVVSGLKPGGWFDGAAAGLPGFEVNTVCAIVTPKARPKPGGT